MDFNLIGFIVVIAGLAALVIVHFARAAKQERVNDTLPVETVRARVKSNKMLLFSGFDRRIFLVFETEKGDVKFGFERQKHFALRLSALRPGDSGILHHQGTRYLGFVQEPYRGGVPAAARFCVNCGAPLAAAAGFCANCGTRQPSQ